MELLVPQMLIVQGINSVMLTILNLSVSIVTAVQARMVAQPSGMCSGGHAVEQYSKGCQEELRHSCIMSGYVI